MVERSSAGRRTHRNQLALPYARPKVTAAPKKIESWFSGILSWIKFPPKNDLDEDDMEEENQELSLPLTNPAAQALTERGHDIMASQDVASRPPLRHNQQQQQPPPLPPYRQPSPNTIQPLPPQPVAGPSTSLLMARSATSPLSDTTPPSNNVQTVMAFLQEKYNKGQSNLNAVECAGITALIGVVPNEDDEKREPFRFSTTPSSRGTTPICGNTAAGTSAPTNGTNAKPRMLSKNPNGTLVWPGGGSACPRNRYRSPGFPSSRPPPVKLNLTPENSTGDAKRRRVGEYAEASTSQQAAAPPLTARSNKPSTSTFPAKSPPPTHQPQPAASAANGLASPARLRTTGLNKPTAPAVPSPLRQAWSQSEGNSPPAVKPTRAANVMTELIKEATPPKQPVFTNPYEAQYPGSLKQAAKKFVKKTRSKGDAKAKAEAAKAAAASEKKAEEQKAQDDDLSPRKIIEATVPKGAKRARPPPELTTQKPEALAPEAGLRRSSRLKSPEPPSAPTTKNFFAFGSPAKEPSVKNRMATVEEVSDEEQPSPSKKPKPQVAKPSAAPAPAPLLPSAFPRPQDLTRTISVEEVDDQVMGSESTPVVRPSQVIEPSDEPSRRSRSPTSPATLDFNPFSTGKGAFPAKSSAPKAPSKLRYSIQPEKDEAEDAMSRELAAAVEPNDGPKSVADVKDWVKGLSKRELPTFSFKFPSATPGAGPSTLKAREDAKSIAAAELPTYPLTFGGPAMFDWAAAGTKKPAQSGSDWKCNTCALMSPDSAKDKCTICEAPRPGAAPKAASQGFNWAAAGVKPLAQGAAEGWKCATCDLQNPASATDKCTVCDSPRPSAKSTAPAVQSFDWAAAGVKPPAKDDADGWKCATCSLQNPASATDKCTVCESLRPSAKPTTPAAQGFNWAAAGMKQPESAAGKWQCKMCLCSSPADATKCTVCDEPR